MPPIPVTKPLAKGHHNDPTSTTLEMPDAKPTETSRQTALNARQGYQANGHTPVSTPKS